jgi:transcription elongation GreA/GreB family factor
VSKAFMKDDEPSPDEPEALPRRDSPQPITPAGYARLREQLAEASRVGASDVDVRRARVLTHVLESVYVVEPSLADGCVGFGTRVTIEDANGARVAYELVGPDEADPVARRISMASPVAQALRGKRIGEQATLRRPKGDVIVTVRSIERA